MENRPSYSRLAPLVLLAFALCGCAGSRANLFLHPDYNFSIVESVAVIPFENLTDDQGAAMRVTRIFCAELLSKRAFDVVEPGEVSMVLEKKGIVRTADLQKAQMREIGKTLGVQALFLGSVTASTSSRSANSSALEVTLVGRLVEIEDGQTIWSATHTEGGKNFFQAVLGLDPYSKSRVTLSCVKGIIKTLIK